MQTRRILILVWPEASAYNATFRLARVLSRRGHEIVYAVPARWVTHVARQGFVSVSLDPSESIVSASIERSGIWTAGTLARKRLSELTEALDKADCRSFGLVLLDAILWHYALPLRRLGIPFLVVNPNLGSILGTDVPPIFSELLPLSSRPLLNAVRSAGAWFLFRYLGAFSHRYRGRIQPRRLGLASWMSDAAIAARHFFRSVLEPFSMPVYHRMLKIARREGIAIRWGDYGYRLADRELVLGPEILDLPGQRRRYARVYAGACVDTERAEDAFDWSRVKPDTPLVYCAVGSHGGHWNAENRLRLLQAVVEAFRARPEYHVLLQTALEDECRPFEPLPDNIIVAPWYPQLEILSRTSILITHGGFGTVREALFYGVPMIVFPCGVDQPGNAARIDRLKAGVRGDIRRVTAATIGAMLRAVEAPPYRQNALSLSGALRADNSCDKAVALIEG